MLLKRIRNPGRQEIRTKDICNIASSYVKGKKRTQQTDGTKRTIFHITPRYTDRKI